MKTWYTADWHLFHRNIIEYCSRPFASVEEMNAAIIGRYVERVQPEDTVYVLGDCTFDEKHAIPLIAALPGHKILVRGNHDRRTLTRHPLWEEWCTTKEILDGDRQVVLSHYYPAEERSVPGKVLYLHGHAHGKRGYSSKRVFDVGVDCWDFRPVTLEEILA